MRDDDHVAVLEVGRGGDQLGEIVSFAHLGQPPERDHTQFAARTLQQTVTYRECR